MKFFHRRRLWLGDDHLLLVSDFLIGESYRRFYFADVQALIWRPTNARLVRVCLWGMLGILFMTLAFWLGNSAIWWFFGAAALSLVFLVLDLAAGPSCQCYIKTAVQFEHLPSLNRVRIVQKALGHLRPLIQKAQANRSAS